MESVKIKREIAIGIVMTAMLASTPVVAAVGSTHSIDNKYASASGMNSCGGWYHASGSYKNYCPFCHKSGTLSWNPKGTPEGEFTCLHCDADFCICGRCKSGGSSVYLVKEARPEYNNAQAVNAPITQPTALDYVKARLNEPLLI